MLVPYSGRSDSNFHTANTLDFSHNRIARHDWTHALRSSRADDIARIEGIERGSQLDQFLYSQNHEVGIRELAAFPVHRDIQVERIRFRNFIGGYQPGSEHGVTIGRFPEASIFGPADSDVECNRISRDI